MKLTKKELLQDTEILIWIALNVQMNCKGDKLKLAEIKLNQLCNEARLIEERLEKGEYEIS